MSLFIALFTLAVATPDVAAVCDWDNGNGTFVEPSAPQSWEQLTGNQAEADWDADTASDLPVGCTVDVPCP